MKLIDISFVGPAILCLIALTGFIWLAKKSSNSPLEVTRVSKATPANDIHETTPMARSTQECPATDAAQARQKAAALLQGIYDKEGRRLSVKATGKDCDVLELSGMLAEGNYSYEAARRETLDCDHCMLLYRKVKFKKVHFVGPDMNAEYAIQ